MTTPTQCYGTVTLDGELPLLATCPAPEHYVSARTRTCARSPRPALAAGSKMMTATVTVNYSVTPVPLTLKSAINVRSSLASLAGQFERGASGKCCSRYWFTDYCQACWGPDADRFVSTLQSIGAIVLRTF